MTREYSYGQREPADESTRKKGRNTTTSRRQNQQRGRRGRRLQQPFRRLEQQVATLKQELRDANTGRFSKISAIIHLPSWEMYAKMFRTAMQNSLGTQELTIDLPSVHSNRPFIRTSDCISIITIWSDSLFTARLLAIYGRRLFCMEVAWRETFFLFLWFIQSFPFLVLCLSCLQSMNIWKCTLLVWNVNIFLRSINLLPVLDFFSCILVWKEILMS